MDAQSNEGRQSAPEPSRPQIKGYGIPESDEGTLPWTWACERLEGALNYWIGTTRPDGRPHAAPVWGAWIDGMFFFEGGPHTRRGRNIAANSAVVVHIERGDDIVIVEGTAEEIANPDASRTVRLIETFTTKYGPKYGYRPDPVNWREGGLYVVRPAMVFAWGRFPDDATRWQFGRA